MRSPVQKGSKSHFTKVSETEVEILTKYVIYLLIFNIIAKEQNSNVT